MMTHNVLSRQSKTKLFDNQKKMTMRGLLAELEKRFELKRTRRTVYRWIKQGCPTAGKANGRDWLFSFDDVALWMERNP